MFRVHTIGQGDELLSWGVKNIQGAVYDLTHLEPFTLRVRPQLPRSPIFAVRVQFGSHCFTRELAANDHDDFHVQDGRVVRCFCPARHGWSLQLPQIIRSAAGGHAYKSLNKNYLLVKDTLGVPYVVCFDVVKARSKKYDAVMTVVSAYQKPNLPKQLPAIPFVALVSRISLAQPVMPGPLKAW